MYVFQMRIKARENYVEQEIRNMGFSSLYVRFALAGEFLEESWTVTI